MMPVRPEWCIHRLKPPGELQSWPLPISAPPAIFRARWSGGRVAEGTGLLNASVPFPLDPGESASVLPTPLHHPRSLAEFGPFPPRLSEKVSAVDPFP
jgi:hypothetical protein